MARRGRTGRRQADPVKFSLWSRAVSEPMAFGLHVEAEPAAVAVDPERPVAAAAARAGRPTWSSRPSCLHSDPLCWTCGSTPVRRFSRRPRPDGPAGRPSSRTRPKFAIRVPIARTVLLHQRPDADAAVTAGCCEIRTAPSREPTMPASPGHRARHRELSTWMRGRGACAVAEAARTQVAELDALLWAFAPWLRLPKSISCSQRAK